VEEGLELKLGLTDFDTYLSSGVHIGTKQKTGAMVPFIYKVRPDGIYVLDIRQTDERIKLAGKFISKFTPQKVLVVSARLYGQKPVQKFGEVTGIKTVVGRFIPGTLTNPSYKGHMEPELLILTDPLADEQPLHEAAIVRIPVIGLCDSDNEISNIELVVPTNNKGRKSLALIYWLLARQVLRERGELPEDKPFEVPVEDFMAEEMELEPRDEE
jgi:small subunit ribosomal protein S2